jgi:hypothetical protein
MISFCKGFPFKFWSGEYCTLERLIFFFGVTQVITLDMGLLVAGTKYRGEFEERLKKLMEEIKQSDEIMLFIDEVHTLIGAGAAEGAIDAANILKPALARGELQVTFSCLVHMIFTGYFF